MEKHKNWKYKNTAFLIFSIILFFFIYDSAIIQQLVFAFSQFGPLGIFITGIFFVSIFTVVPASALLLFFAKSYDPLTVAILGGAGAVLGDYLIFRFLKDRIFEELAPLFNKAGGSHLKKLFHTSYFVWLMPLLGAAIVASPLPDEIGLGLMGLSKIKTWQFVILTFILNSVGIFLIASLAFLSQ